MQDLIPLLAKEKRQYGYFSLPILFNDSLVGRVDCKAHRKIGELELINLHLESKEINLDKFIPHFTKTVYRFAKFNDCQSIRVSNVRPKKLKGLFSKALNAFEKKS